MSKIATKKRITRDRPNKKWTDAEVIKILDYLEEERDEFEAPTAQVFYKKLLARKKINATWDLLRWKVRHLKAGFKTAEERQKLAGAELSSRDGTLLRLEGSILSKCPHYYKLAKIFGNGKGNKAAAPDIENYMGELSSSLAYDGSSPSNSTPNENFTNTNDMFVIIKPEELSLPASEQSSNENAFEMAANVNNRFVEKLANTASETPPNVATISDPMKKFPAKSSLAHLASLQAERIAFQRMRFEFEREKHNKELEMEERRLCFEEEKLRLENELKNRELELKILQIEQGERIQRLEIEKRERIEMFELELKYRSKT